MDHIISRIIYSFVLTQHLRLYKLPCSFPKLANSLDEFRDTSSVDIKRFALEWHIFIATQFKLPCRSKIHFLSWFVLIIGGQGSENVFAAYIVHENLPFRI